MAVKMNEAIKVLSSNMANNGTAFAWVTIGEYLKLPVMEPAIQRGNVWDTKQYAKLLETISDGDVIPSLSLGRVGDGETLWLIDGKQRTGAIRYLSNITDTSVKVAEGRKYATPEEKRQAVDNVKAIRRAFYDYKLPIQIRSYSTQDEMEQAFTRQNNGTPLTKAQRTKSEYCGKIVALLNKVNSHRCLSLLSKKVSTIKIDGASYTDEKVRKADDIATFLVFAHFAPESASTSSTATVAALKKYTDDNIESDVGAIWEALESTLDRVSLVYDKLQDKEHKKALSVLSQPNNLLLLFLLAKHMYNNTEKEYICTVCKLYDIDTPNPTGKPRALPFSYREDGIAFNSSFESMFGAGSGNNAAATRRRMAGALRAAEITLKEMQGNETVNYTTKQLESLIEDARGVLDDDER